MTRIPVTELANDLSAQIESLDARGFALTLQQCDLQIFDGWRGSDSLLNPESLGINTETQNKVANMTQGISKLLLWHLAGHRQCCVVFSGCGTSGRVAFMTARRFNRVLASLFPNKCGEHCPPFFHYLISGGDSALLLSDELPEDDPLTAAAELKAIVESHDASLLVGVTCGLSAPYVAGQLDFAMHACSDPCGTPGAAPGGCGACVVGFNSVEDARDRPIELWEGQRSFKDVLKELAALSAPSTRSEQQGSKAGGHPTKRRRSWYSVVNPVVGPEAIAGSSRMKGGTATHVILDAACVVAIQSVVAASRPSSRSPAEANATTAQPPPSYQASDESRLAAAAAATAAHDDDDDDQGRAGWFGLDATRAALRRQFASVALAAATAAYSDLPSLVVAMEAAAAALRPSPPQQPLLQQQQRRDGGRLCFLASHGGAGCMAFVDASEMPDTYGSPFEETRAFVGSGGWLSVGGNLEGDLAPRGPLYRISLKAFEREVAPTLHQGDCVCVVLLSDGSSSSSSGATTAAADTTSERGRRLKRPKTSGGSKGSSSCTSGTEGSGGGHGDGDGEEQEGEKEEDEDKEFASLASAVAAARRCAGPGLRVVGLGAAMVLLHRHRQQHHRKRGQLPSSAAPSPTQAEEAKPRQQQQQQQQYLGCEEEKKEVAEAKAAAVSELKVSGASLGCEAFAAVAVAVPPPLLPEEAAASTLWLNEEERKGNGKRTRGSGAAATSTATETSTTTTSPNTMDDDDDGGGGGGGSSGEEVGAGGGGGEGGEGGGVLGGHFGGGYDGPAVLCLKLMLNAVSTYAQAVGKGAVFHGRMICTGPTNDKIYNRCVRLISEFVPGVNERAATEALLKAVYRVDELASGVLELPTSTHIKAATPALDQATSTSQVTLPIAFLLALGPDWTVRRAEAALVSEPRVSVILKHELELRSGALAGPSEHGRQGGGRGGEGIGGIGGGGGGGARVGEHSPFARRPRRLAVGVDLGGTNVRAGVVELHSPPPPPLPALSLLLPSSSRPSSSSSQLPVLCGPVVSVPLVPSGSSSSASRRPPSSLSFSAVCDRIVDVVHAAVDAAVDSWDPAVAEDATTVASGGGGGGKGKALQALEVRQLIELVAVSQPGQVSSSSSSSSSAANGSGSGGSCGDGGDESGGGSSSGSSDGDVVVEAVAFPEWPARAPLARELASRLTTGLASSSSSATTDDAVTEGNNPSRLVLPKLNGVRLFEDSGCHLMGELALASERTAGAAEAAAAAAARPASIGHMGGGGGGGSCNGGDGGNGGGGAWRVGEEASSCSALEEGSAPSSSTVLVCVGTGVGTAVACGGALLRGSQGLIEGGHIVTCAAPPQNSQNGRGLTAPSAIATAGASAAAAAAAAAAGDAAGAAAGDAGCDAVAAAGLSALPPPPLPRECGCGQVGCAEAHASGPAIAAIANAFLAASLPSYSSSTQSNLSGSSDAPSATPFFFPDCAAVFAAAFGTAAPATALPPPQSEETRRAAPPAPAPAPAALAPPPAAAAAATAPAAAAAAALAAVDHAALNLAKMCLALARSLDPSAFLFSGGVFGTAAAPAAAAANAPQQHPFLVLIEQKFRALNWKLGHPSLPAFRVASSPHSAVVGAVTLATRDPD